MFLNILRLSASNVLDYVLNVIVVLGVQLLFSVRTNQPEEEEEGGGAARGGVGDLFLYPELL